MSAAAVVSFDPLREKRYRETALGRDVVDFLAWGELGGWSERTRDQYERDLSRGCLMFPSKGIAELEDGDAIQIAKSFKPGERRVRVAAWRSFYKWAGASLPPLRAQPVRRAADDQANAQACLMTCSPTLRLPRSAAWKSGTAL
jgi:hypothetical protein